MEVMSKLWLALVVTCGLTFLSYQSLGQQISILNIYVSKAGNDLNEGSISRPLNTLQAAQAKIRSIKSSQPSKMFQFNVYIRAGTYFLKNSIEFNAQDGGWPGAPVIYQAYPGEKVVLSGGSQLKGWLADKNGVYKTSALGLKFRQLYSGSTPGVNPTRARFPKLNPMSTGVVDLNAHFGLQSWSTAVENGVNVVKGVSLKTNPYLTHNGYNYQNTEMVILKTHTMSRLNVDQFEHSSTGSFFLFKTADQKTEGNSVQFPWMILPNYLVYFENAREFVTNPGEWYFDRNQNTVYYYPQAISELQKNEVIVPRLNNLVLIAGDSALPVKFLTLKNLEFRHTTWNEPSEIGFSGAQSTTLNYGSGGVPGALQIRYSENIAIENCFIGQLGGAGVEIGAGSNQISIKGNFLSDISGNAITIKRIYYRGMPVMPLIQNVQIKQNYIYRFGAEYDGIAILMAQAVNSAVENNTIRFGPYTGINIGWWGELEESVHGNISVLRNDISNVMRTLDDGGAIYTLYSNPKVIISQNYIHDIIRHPVNVGPNVQAAIYLDERTHSLGAYYNQISNVTDGIFIQFTPGAEAHDNRTTSNYFFEVTKPYGLDRWPQAAILWKDNNNSFDVTLGVETGMVSYAGVNDVKTKNNWRVYNGFYGKGLFRVGAVIYYSLNGFDYCGFNSWSEFTSKSGLSSSLTLPPYSQLPASMTACF